MSCFLPVFRRSVYYATNLPLYQANVNSLVFQIILFFLVRFVQNIKKAAAIHAAASLYACEYACKPGSVLTVIYLRAPSPVRSSHLGSGRAGLYAPIPVLLRIEFTATVAFTRRRVSSYLAFPPLPHRRKADGRYISVALFLKSPSAGVTRYPRPMEPGLSSRTGFRHVPATVRRTRRLYCSEAPPESQRKIQRIRKGEASVTMPLPPLSLTLSPACRCTSAKTVHCR